MKKVFLTMMLVGATVMCAQAQLFVGGTIGMDYGAGKTTVGSNTNKGPSVTDFQIRPMVGYHLSESLTVGARVGLDLSFISDRQDDPTKTNTTGWTFEPFARYNMLNVGSLSLLIEGAVGISGDKEKLSAGSTSVELEKNFSFGVHVQPILQYKLTDRLSLEAATDLARLTFATTTTTTPAIAAAGTGDSKDTNTSFGLGVNSGAPFRIGVIFNL